MLMRSNKFRDVRCTNAGDAYCSFAQNEFVGRGGFATLLEHRVIKAKSQGSGHNKFRFNQTLCSAVLQKYFTIAEVAIAANW